MVSVRQFLRDKRPLLGEYFDKIDVPGVVLLARLNNSLELGFPPAQRPFLM